MLSDSMGQNSKDSLALLHNLEGLKTSEVLLSHMSGLWWWTSTGEAQLISLVPVSGLV